MLLRQSIKLAFTLIELLVVVIVIAVLASICYGIYVNAGTRGQEASLRADLKQIRNAVDLFHADTTLYPASLTDLTLTTSPAHGLNSQGQLTSLPTNSYRGPYLSQIDPDPIDGSTFTYKSGSGDSGGSGNNTIGQVHASSGTALDGTNYSTW